MRTKPAFSLAIATIFAAAPPVFGQEKNSNLLAEVNTTAKTTAGSITNSAIAVTDERARLRKALDTPLDGKLSLAVINRIEDLPKEKLDVHAGKFSDDQPQENAEVTASALIKKQADHWKPLLTTLIAHHHKIDIPLAEAKLKNMLDISEKLGQAAVVQAGVEIGDPDQPAMEARFHATEALLADYVEKVMRSRRNEAWWAEWRDAWNRGVVRIPAELVGQWTVETDTGINFAQAIIADHRCTLIWQERAGAKVQKIDFDVMKATPDQLYADEHDTQGLRYKIEPATPHQPRLIFDVPGRQAGSIIKLQLRPDW